MDRFTLQKLMTSIIYAGLCKELQNIQDEELRRVRREQLMREARDTAHRFYSDKLNLSWNE